MVLLSLTKQLCPFIPNCSAFQKINNMFALTCLATPAILGAVVTNVLCDPALTVVLINWVSMFDGWYFKMGAATLQS